MIHPPITDLNDWARALLAPTALAELGILAGCLLVSYALVRLWRGRFTQPRSIWFGARTYDGVLFPALALALAYTARALLAGSEIPVAVFRVAVPILGSLLIIRVGVRVLRVAFPDSPFVRALERTLSWVVWIWLALWLTGVLPLVLREMEEIKWSLAGSTISARSVLDGALSVAAVMVGALWLSSSIETRLLAGTTSADFRGNLSLRKIAANATRALLLLLGLLMALSAAGIPLAALSVLGGAVGVGIGFGLQKLASNYVSGFVILAENSLRIGDIVKVDGFEGRITDINTRYTVIRAGNGRESLVPNELMITQRVESATLGGDSKVVVTTTVQVAYGTDLDALFPRLVDAVLDVPGVLRDPGPGVQLLGFGANGLDLQVGFWVDDPMGAGGVRGNVNLALLRTLDALDVEIPYPQQVVREPFKPKAAGDAER